MVEQYSADPDNYLNFHTVLNQVVSIIGEGRIVQNSIFFKKRNILQNHLIQFLQQKYSEHFDGRTFKTIETVLLFTDIVDDKLKKKNKQYNHSEKATKNFVINARKFYASKTRAIANHNFILKRFLNIIFLEFCR